MPEGPEIKRAAERIAAAIVGHPTERVQFGLEPLKVYEHELEGRPVVAVEARGKAMLIRFEGTPLRIYSHNQLYGRWMTCKPEQPPRTRRTLRLAIHTPHRWALLYSASDIAVLHDDRDEAEHDYLRRLGPDVLDPAVSTRHVTNRLRDPRFRGRQLAALYLDQGFLCGPGNYLRSEILFVAGVDPTLRPKDLSAAQVRDLGRASLEVSRRAFDLRGVTVEERLMRDLKAAGCRRRDYRHYVFGRSGQPCRRCGATIEKALLGGRRLYRCPRCQHP